MSKENSVNSSDIEGARAISQRLRPAPAPQPSPTKFPGMPVSGYAPFAAQRFRAALAPSQPIPEEEKRALEEQANRAPLPEPILGERSAFGAEPWVGLLDWCLAVACADSAFAIDEHGLVIAARGRELPVEIEEVGTRLMMAFEQTCRLNLGAGLPQRVDVSFAERVLTGFGIDLGGSARLTVGIWGGGNPDSRMGAILDRTVRRMLEVR